MVRNGKELGIARSDRGHPACVLSLYQPFRISARKQAETVPSRNGRAQLRMLPVRIGGSTLLVTTSLAGLAKTEDRLDLTLIIGSSCAALLVAVAAAHAGTAEAAPRSPHGLTVAMTLPA